MEDMNKILKSLLAKQGMEGFLPLEKPEKCKLQVPLFGYIKDKQFFICDESINVKNREDCGIRQNGSLLICIVDEKYVVSDSVVSDNCFVISSKNEILGRHPKEYSYINSECFIIGKTIDLGDSSDGLVMDCEKFQKDMTSKYSCKYFIIPQIADCEIDGDEHHGNYYTDDPRVIVPSINIDNKVYVNGSLNENLIYLFSAKGRTFLFDKVNNIFVVYGEERFNRVEKLECKADYIWISRTHAHIIGILPPEDVDYGNLTDVVEFKSYGIATHEINLNESVSLLRQHEVAVTSHYLLINIDNGGYNYSSGAFIIIDKNGSICFSDILNYSSWEFVNNLLRIKEPEQSYNSYYDCFGNLVAEDDIQNNSKYAIAEQVTQSYPFYNNYDLPIYLFHQDKNIRNSVNRDWDKLNIRQGVINLITGKIVIPINFSGVITKNVREPFSSEEHPSYKQMTIVWIDNFNGGKISFYGLYADDKLLIPIFYDSIGYIQYDYYKEGSKKSYEKGDTKFLYIEKDGYYGVMDCWGREILPIEASKVKCLTDNMESEYILAYDKESYIRLIYRNIIVSDYEYTSAKAISPKELKMEYAIHEQIVKLESEDAGISFIYQGKEIVSHLYGEVSIFGCNIFRNKEEDYLPIIFFAEYEESKIVYDHNGNEVIRIDEGESIEIQKAFISVNGVIYGNEMDELVNLCGAELLKSVRNYNGEVRTYHTQEGNYVILYFDDWNVDFEEIEAKNAIGLSEKIIDWQYDFENNQFKYVPEDDSYDYNDYSDDTDYDRETYYALGGDDYDAFKERGGSIDDMMDGMGY